MARGKISLSSGVQCCLNLLSFLLSYQRLYIVNNMCIYTDISDCVETVYELPLLPNNNTASETFLHKSGAVRSVDWIFIIGPSLIFFSSEYKTAEGRGHPG